MIFGTKTELLLSILICNIILRIAEVFSLLSARTDSACTHKCASLSVLNSLLTSRIARVPCRAQTGPNLAQRARHASRAQHGMRTPQAVRVSHAARTLRAPRAQRILFTLHVSCTARASLRINTLRAPRAYCVRVAHIVHHPCLDRRAHCERLVHCTHRRANSVALLA